MSSPTDPASAGSAPSDPAELRRSIEETRGELADTVNALAAKADVKSRTQDKTQQLKAQAANKAREVRAQAMAKAPQLAKVPQLTGQAQQKAQQVVQEKPGAAVGAALAVLGLLVLRRRRRRRGKEDS
jgi:MYXO-CTERM domain-containing protein